MISDSLKRLMLDDDIKLAEVLSKPTITEQEAIDYINAQPGDMTHAIENFRNGGDWFSEYKHRYYKDELDMLIETSRMKAAHREDKKRRLNQRIKEIMESGDSEFIDIISTKRFTDYEAGQYITSKLENPERAIDAYVKCGSFILGEFDVFCQAELDSLIAWARNEARND